MILSKVRQILRGCTTLIYIYIYYIGIIPFRESDGACEGACDEKVMELVMEHMSLSCVMSHKVTVLSVVTIVTKKSFFFS